LNRAQNIKTEAVSNREKVISEAAYQSQEILYLARSAAEQECNEMKNLVHFEVQRTMAEAELAKAAAQEELETEKIYAETARLEVESFEVLSKTRANLADPAAYLRSNFAGGPHLQHEAGWESGGSGDATAADDTV
jgi:hypothetical protein